RPAPRPAPRPAAAPRPLKDLPATQLKPSSAVALEAVAAARALVGTASGTDVSLVRTAWSRAGGHALPLDRRALVTKAVQVPRPWLRVGDLVAYGTPASQVYLYAGSGYMVGWSPDHGAVVVRRVHTGDVRFLRLPV
ncbi:MAG: hypothetical protein JWN17_2060, partial [Frankiales bacterium]|nr:hypothetical protein [Frankiales bacterium]